MAIRKLVAAHDAAQLDNGVHIKDANGIVHFALLLYPLEGDAYPDAGDCQPALSAGWRRVDAEIDCMTCLVRGRHLD